MRVGDLKYYFSCVCGGGCGIDDLMLILYMRGTYQCDTEQCSTVNPIYKRENHIFIIQIIYLNSNKVP